MIINIRRKFIMLRTNLLKSNYYFEERAPKKDVITALWIVLCLFLVSATISLSFYVMVKSQANPEDGSVLSAAVIINIVALATPFLYFILKYILTALFCSDKKQNIEMTVLKEIQMPVCRCREALKIWQAMMIYLLPAVVVYFSLCGIILLGNFDAHYIVLTLFMSFFISFDLALVLYIIYVKLKYNPDYIAVNQHIYNVTLYTQTYIRRKKKK